MLVLYCTIRVTYDRVANRVTIGADQWQTLYTEAAATAFPLNEYTAFQFLENRVSLAIKVADQLLVWPCPVSDSTVT